MRTLMRWSLSALVVLLLVAATGLWRLGQPTGAAVTDISITSGMSARAIGQRLQQAGLIQHARYFVWLARWRGVSDQLEAGNYRLTGTASTGQLLDTLLEAPLEMVRVTIPEGLTRHEIASILQAAELADSSHFIAATNDDSLIAQLGVPASSLEGYLFPETYFLPPDIDEKQIARLMVAEFFKVFSDAHFARLESIQLTLHEAVTLASIVEREAVAAEERPTIAAVFLRRLGLKRRLESCATVEFALGVHKKRLTNADLWVVSPYNTYRHSGLPPGPIGSPGRASIEASLHPVPTEYLYFVARGDGTHQFSRTNREHEAAKRAIRLAERRSRLN
ncbi:MAG: endolytic transglycosylase MltG [Gemmatimonadetes bacterium]|jgi:UPF0755 protein|nr:endolytic transglycosylase MltG [Gemmatimonadota bacterium]MBT5058302.1 endolytic transglycosylase MltG [Gemmatimonadota bacterium]MBT5588529.1 endolytic transglycosylase MltG [Gemmatimonadota bacterium]MBT5964628.1 endolytic transglycosylase MltG [Gemmatimonadota bacterium]MBT7597943.1 endolytic transglycosylase MltG [Gemmatimonadota bacterium]